MKLTRALPLAACLLATGTVSGQSLETSKTFLSDYSISMMGLPLGQSSFKTVISGDAYRVDGELRSAGIARIFDKTVANSRVEGVFTDAGAQSKTYSLNYVSGDKKSKSALVFSGGNVVSANVTPKPKMRKSYVPVEEAHMRAVADPLTAAIVKANSLNDVCNRTLRVFDGKMRLDLQLSNPRVASAQVPGFKGETVTCAAKFVPISGYRKGQKSIEFLRTSNGISITFAQNGSTGVYGPLKASVQTYLGQLDITATKFSMVR